MSFQPTDPTSVQHITAPEPPPSEIDTRFAGRLYVSGGVSAAQTLQHLYDLPWLTDSPVM